MTQRAMLNCDGGVDVARWDSQMSVTSSETKETESFDSALTDVAILALFVLSSAVFVIFTGYWVMAWF